jgi:CheY-like chemotaxis protein
MDADGVHCKMKLRQPVQEPGRCAGSNYGADLPVAGIRVFVVEDESLVLLELQDMLTDRGFVVAGSAVRLEEATTKAHEVECDVAVLDVNLAGQRIDPVARVLAERNIPFVFVSGYDRSALPPGFQDRPLLAKPYGPSALVTALKQCLTPQPA